MNENTIKNMFYAIHSNPNYSISERRDLIISISKHKGIDINNTIELLDQNVVQERNKQCKYNKKDMEYIHHRAFKRQANDPHDPAHIQRRLLKKLEAKPKN